MSYFSSMVDFLGEIQIFIEAITYIWNQLSSIFSYFCSPKIISGNKCTLMSNLLSYELDST